MEFDDGFKQVISGKAKKKKSRFSSYCMRLPF